MIKNLYELYNLIEKVSTALPNVNQFVNSFDSLNREDTSYAAVVLQFRDGTQATEGSVRYRFYLGYVDRVNENTDTPSTSNNILTQSIAEENIRLIINKLYPEVDITFGNTFYPFTQRFTALTAGCYVELAITLAVKDCNYESGSVLRDVEIVSDSNGVKEVVPGSGVDGFKKVIVRTEVPPSDFIDVDGMKYAYSEIKEFPSRFKFAMRTGENCYNMFYNCKSLITIPRLDTSNATNMTKMFYNCISLTNIPQLDTSNVIRMDDMFMGCSSLTTIPLLSTSKVTNTCEMFYSCKSLTSVPLLDTRSVTNMSNMFYICTSLTSVPLLDTRSVTNMSNMFRGCTSLTSVPLFDTRSVTNMSNMFYLCTSLTTLGGFTNLKVNLDLSPCSKLTHDSLMNVINEAADVTSSPKTLTLGSTNLNKLTDEEKAIATNKGWTLS